jgi:ParB family chromosome partitioning protein
LDAQKRTGDVTLRGELPQADQRDRKENGDQILEVPLRQLHSFKDHPFLVLDDESMESLVESVKKYGVMTPGIVRPLPGGDYEMISGHRRKRACQLAGLTAMPVVIRKMDDDAATILMCDSNLQRETILPSERAFAYKLKLEVMNHQGDRTDLTCAQVEHRFAGMKSRDLLARQTGQSSNQVSRFVRLTRLIPELMQMVDEKKIAFNPAVELSYLSVGEQKLLLDSMAAQAATPSLSQAQRLKNLSQDQKLSAQMMDAILSEEKKEVEKVTLTGRTLQKYFPRSYTPRQMEATIIKLLEQWQRKRRDTKPK